MVLCVDEELARMRVAKRDHWQCRRSTTEGNLGLTSIVFLITT